MSTAARGSCSAIRALACGSPGHQRTCQSEGRVVFYYLLKYVLLGPLLRLVFRPRIEGLDNVPAAGPAIVAGNHLSFSDHFLMPAILKRRITFLAKAEYFTGPGLKGRLTAFFFR